MARLLVPTEHGAWAELLFPLATALVVGAPTQTTWVLASAVLAGFLASEGVQTLAGLRGPRARRDQGRRAATAAGLFGAWACIAGGWAWVLAPPPERVVMLAAVALVAGVASLAALGRLKTLAGECLAGLALTTWSVPVALSGGAPVSLAMAPWLVWTASFVGATLAVRALIARQTRRPARAAQWGAVAVAVLGALVITVQGGRGAWPLALVPGFAPTACAICVVALAPIPARRLRVVGWALVVASLLLFGAFVGGA